MSQFEFPQGDLTHLNRLIKLLADPNRMQILNLLMEGVQCNCELGSRLEIAPNLISHHLNSLRAEGLVRAERDPQDARWVYYSIDLEQAANLRRLLNNFLDPDRIRPRQPQCGPRSNPTPDVSIHFTEEQS